MFKTFEKRIGYVRHLLLIGVNSISFGNELNFKICDIGVIGNFYVCIKYIKVTFIW